MIEPLTTQELESALEQVKGWSFSEDSINKEFKFNDFKEAMGFLVRIGFEAEEQGHHPELFNVYNTVKISLKTHDAGDKVTSKDIQLAKTINKLVD